MAKNDVLRNIFLEDDLSNFKDFFDKEWFGRVNGLVENTRFEKVVGNFAINWWGSARAFILPWLLVTGISDVINEFTPTLLEVTPQKAWSEYLKRPEFNVALWKLTENVYCSIYFAYENLIVNMLKEILGTSIRVTRKDDFKKKLRAVYGEEVARTIWHQTSVYVARETRNSIVHNGGKATDALLKVKPIPHYIKNDDVVISAIIVRDLFSELKPLVDELVKKSLEKNGS